MGSHRLPPVPLLIGIPLVGLGMLLSAMAVADPYKPYNPPQIWPDAGHQGTGWAADPPPLHSAHQWILTLRYDTGKVQLVGSRPLQLAQPVVTARRVGRYAIELLSGPDLVDRVRFDFPLLAADELAGQPRRPFNDPPRFERKAVVTHQVMVPDSPRISRARLVDRATGTSMMLPWPPLPAPVLRDAGADASDAGSDGAVWDGSVVDARSTDAWPMPDGWPLPDVWPAPVPRDAAPIPRPVDAGPFDASR